MRITLWPGDMIHTTEGEYDPSSAFNSPEFKSNFPMIVAYVLEPNTLVHVASPSELRRGASCIVKNTRVGQ